MRNDERERMRLRRLKETATQCSPRKEEIKVKQVEEVKEEPKKQDEEVYVKLRPAVSGSMPIAEK